MKYKSILGQPWDLSQMKDTKDLALAITRFVLLVIAIILLVFCATKYHNSKDSDTNNRLLIRFTTPQRDPDLVTVNYNTKSSTVQARYWCFVSTTCKLTFFLNVITETWKTSLNKYEI